MVITCQNIFSIWDKRLRRGITITIFWRFDLDDIVDLFYEQVYVVDKVLSKRNIIVEKISWGVLLQPKDDENCNDIFDFDRFWSKNFQFWNNTFHCKFRIFFFQFFLVRNWNICVSPILISENCNKNYDIFSEMAENWNFLNPTIFNSSIFELFLHINFRSFPKKKIET